MGCRIVLIVNLIINVSLPRHPLSERGAAKRRGVSHQPFR